MRFAYADPPYPGVAHRYPEHEEVDHAKLIQRLCEEFPDGWALSTKSNALRDLLPIAPPNVRIGAWTKRYAAALKGVRPVYAWEPVLFMGGRVVRDDLCLDWHLADPCLPRFQPDYVLGKKPDSFSYWIFHLLGARSGDELVDLFPGTGAVSRAWDAYVRQLAFSESGPSSLFHVEQSSMDIDGC